MSDDYDDIPEPIRRAFADQTYLPTPPWRGSWGCPSRHYDDMIKLDISVGSSWASGRSGRRVSIVLPMSQHSFACVRRESYV
jgi:hypothetical protein